MALLTDGKDVKMSQAIWQILLINKFTWTIGIFETKNEEMQRKKSTSTAAIFRIRWNFECFESSIFETSTFATDIWSCCVCLHTLYSIQCTEKTNNRCEIRMSIKSSPNRWFLLMSPRKILSFVKYNTVAHWFLILELYHIRRCVLIIKTSKIATSFDEIWQRKKFEKIKVVNCFRNLPFGLQFVDLWRSFYLL